MSPIKSNSAPEEDPVYVVVYAGPHGGWREPTTREKAIETFDECVATGVLKPGMERRMSITAPDRYVLAADDDAEVHFRDADEVLDKLLTGEAALRAVLKPAEYDATVLAPLAAALLES